MATALLRPRTISPRTPDVVKRFVRASLKGWKFTIANPDKAAADQIKYVATLKPEVIVAEIKVVTDLAVTDETKKNGLGWFDPAKMKANVDFVEKYIGISGKAADCDGYLRGRLSADASHHALTGRRKFRPTLKSKRRGGPIPPLFRSVISRKFISPSSAPGKRRSLPSRISRSI